MSESKELQTPKWAARFLDDPRGLQVATNHMIWPGASYEKHNLPIFNQTPVRLKRTRWAGLQRSLPGFKGVIAAWREERRG